MGKFLLVVFSFLISYQAFTQCTPDANLNHSGYYPSPLPDGTVGIAYSQSITFQFPTDTTIVVFGNPQTIHIDTIIITSVTGFPSSYMMQCNAQECKYWGSPLRGCMQVSGTPSSADTGTRKLVIKVTVKFKLAGSPVAFPITDSSQSYTVLKSSVGLNRGPKIQNYTFGIDQITPNPFTQKTVLTVTSGKTEKIIIAIRDILGKEVYVTEGNVRTGINNFTIDTEDFKPGYYLLSVSSSSGVITRKITKR
jgi:hypothetical protein